MVTSRPRAWSWRRWARILRSRSVLRSCQPGPRSRNRAERHGARVALFGRKIQRAESQLDLVSLMRPVLRGDLSPADAVRAYHETLAKAEIAPRRELEADLQVTDPVLRSE